METKLKKLALNQETLGTLTQDKRGTAFCASSPISCNTKPLSCPECNPPDTMFC
jgi:hypothetical protein